MKSIKGPAIFLAQFAGDAAPFDTFDGICGWAAKLGYKGVQIPAWDERFIDLKKAAGSKTYAQEIVGTARKNGVEITELATHLQGQLVAVNPVYDEAFDAFAAKPVRGNPKKRQEWATEQVTLAAKASRNMGLGTHVTFSGALAWPFLYPWPPLPPGLIETAFDELARRWEPILDAHEEQGVDVCFELHPGEDLFDGTTFADNELIDLGLTPKSSRRMGHIPMSGPEGSIAAFAGLPVGRKIFIHLNNSNPVLIEDSPERRRVEGAGWEVAYDGMEIDL